MRDIADAEIGDRLDLRRNAQRRAQIVMPDNADPADTDLFDAGGEPEVLHRADRAVEIHVGLMGSAEPDRAGAAAVAGDADSDRRVDDALKLETAVGFPPLVPEHPG